VLPLAGGSLSAQETPKSALKRASVSNKVTAGDRELARLRADLIEKMKESRASAEKLLALHEEEKKKFSEQYERRRVLYYQGLISRAELNQVERALAVMILRVDEDKRWLTESDIAITEASLRDELLRLPGLAVGGYSESATLVRFNGGAPWSLTDAPKIEKFFSQAFGHTLPISAFGQTATHDRLRFDHRNAMDVALHPDSDEGKSLLSYLRQAGIPFIAFRHAVPGAATGAHIHIGNPSIRN
jgi:acetyl esterase/lipase